LLWRKVWISPRVARGGKETIAVLACEPAVTRTRGRENTYHPKLRYELRRFIPNSAPNFDAITSEVNGCIPMRAWPSDASTVIP